MGSPARVCQVGMSVACFAYVTSILQKYHRLSGAFQVQFKVLIFPFIAQDSRSVKLLICMNLLTQRASMGRVRCESPPQENGNIRNIGGRSSG